MALCLIVFCCRLQAVWIIVCTAETLHGEAALLGVVCAGCTYFCVRCKAQCAD